MVESAQQNRGDRQRRRALTDAHERHARRVAGLDPLVRLPRPGDDLEQAVAVVTEGSQGDIAAIWVGEQRTDPATTMSLWVAGRTATLRLRVGSDRAASAVEPLLREALGRAAQHGLGDLEAGLTVASRDTALVRPLLRAGFAPATVLAVRRLDPDPDPDPDPADPPEAPCLTVRTATAEDADARVTARLALHAFEQTVSPVPAHPDARTLLEADVAEDLRDRPDFCWVAEQDGRVVGVCDTAPPGHTDWVGGSLTEAPAAYVKNLFVDGSARGSGVGAALVATAHAALGRAGARVLALHHGATNPLSAPFWARAGYRPLLTTWVRHPR